MTSYHVGDATSGLEPTAYLEPFGVGDCLADMPAFLIPDHYVNVPLESTYMTAWENCPPGVQSLVEHGRLPDEDETPDSA